MLATVTWLARIAACALIGVLTFVTNPPTGAELALEMAGFVVCLGVVVYWLAVDLGWAGPERLLLSTGLGATAAVVSGVLAMSPHGGALIGFAFMAVLAAGADAAALPGWVMTALAVLSVEVGALVWNTDTSAVWGYPLLLIVAFIVGRNRRAYLVQARQSDALLVQLEQLRSEQRQVAVLGERTRIAREIHDVLAHSLGALGIQIQAVRAVLTDNHDIDQALGLLEQAQRMANDGLVDTRRAVHALRGDATRLDEQLTTLIGTHRSRHGASVKFTITGEPIPLTPETTVALIRTAQEALVNTAKHAAHQPVEVDLDYTDRVRLAVSNLVADSTAALIVDGDTGFSSVNGGYGLTGIRERLLLINGTLTISSDDHRWTVTAQIPIDRIAR